MSSTDSAGDVHFLMHHVVPESFTGFQQALILRCPCHIRHAGIEIYGAYGVPLHLILLTHRAVCLIVAISFLALRAGQTALDIVIVWFCSAFIDEVFRKIKILLLAGQIIETRNALLLLRDGLFRSPDNRLRRLPSDDRSSTAHGCP